MDDFFELAFLHKYRFQVIPRPNFLLVQTMIDTIDEITVASRLPERVFRSTPTTKPAGQFHRSLCRGLMRQRCWTQARRVHRAIHRGRPPVSWRRLKKAHQQKQKGVYAHE